MIQIDEKHLKILLAILKKYPYSFYAFGSRVKGEQQKFSDLDLCYKEFIPLNILNQIKSDLNESNLPFNVDLIDYLAASEDFQNLIKNDLIKINSN